MVSLSSVAARQGKINFADLQGSNYNAMQVYSQSKLACLMFAFELQRRSEAGKWGVTSIAAHPGISRTDLLHNGPGSRSAYGMFRSLFWFMFQPAAQGALPTLYAATSPMAKGGGYYGPGGFGEANGFPSLSKVPPLANDTSVTERLWRVSEELAEVNF